MRWSDDFENNASHRTYLGDHIYAEYEDGELLLTREDKKGRVADVIPMDISVLMLLIQFLAENASSGVLNMIRRMLREY